MEIQVKLEELKKHKLFVATPMYGGMNHGLYMKSCLDLQTTMHRYGIEIKCLQFTVPPNHSKESSPQLLTCT